MAFEENRKKRSIATEHAVTATTDGMRGEAASSDANQLALILHSDAPLSPPPKRDPKRNQVSEGKDGVGNTKNPLAGSFEGRRRGQ